jgi:RNA polymerase sigma factor (sigma-70 family)
MAGATSLDPAPTAHADATLAARLRVGDEAALAELYDRFGATALGIARRVTGDVHAAEEAVQETFLWVWTHADRFDPARGTLRSWLAVLCYRRAVDWVRAEVARRRPVSDHGSGLAASAEEVALEAEEARLAEQLAHTVRAAVDTLPPAQRDVVRLLYFEGRRVADIAATLGVPEGTAKTRLRAARQRLAERLGTQGLVTA